MSNLESRNLTVKRREGDRSVAILLNEMEYLGVSDEISKKELSGYMSKLKVFAESVFPDSVKRYLVEIKGVVESVFERYREEGMDVPDVSFLDN
tara:strand:- start:5721 stop:6002 length:282 start_codon:yes stop_codon:yes gene_type:complete